MNAGIMAFLLSIGLVMGNLNQNTEMEKSKIIYVFDPMCGWCYGFSPVISELSVKYDRDFDFEVISGGMVIGDREGPIGDMADYILGAIPRLQDYTGVVIGEPYIELLKGGTYFSSSEMPSIALQVFKHLSDKNAIRFAHDIQFALFYYGKSLNDINTYLELIKPYNIDRESFITCMNDPKFREATFKEFKYADDLGATAYPTMLLQKGNEITVLARGYVNKDRMTSLLESHK